MTHWSTLQQRTATAALILSLFAMSACDQGSVATPAPTTISIAGATAMQPVLEALTQTFSQDHPNVHFDIRGGGSTLGEEQALSGEIDVAASTLFPDALPGGSRQTESNDGDGSAAELLIRTPIGLDGIAVVVNQRNSVQSLSVLQLRDLFSGRTLAWSAFDDGDGAAQGGVDGGDNELDDSERSEVLLVSREDGSGTRSLFEERIMGSEDVSLTAVVMPSSADVVDYVALHPLAIGYVSRAYVHDAVELSGIAENGDATAVNPSPVSVVAVEGDLPDVELLRSQEYFLTQPLFLVTAGEPVGWTRAFIDFVLGPSGQEIVDRFHARIR